MLSYGFKHEAHAPADNADVARRALAPLLGSWPNPEVFGAAAIPPGYRRIFRRPQNADFRPVLDPNQT
jgi:hypothetical protein